MTDCTLIIYGADWCWDCRRTRKYLDQHAIAYTWIDIDRDKNAEQIVKKLNNGMRSIPTMIFPDGSTLVEPSSRELEMKFGRG